jgi:Peptidase family M48
VLALVPSLAARRFNRQRPLLAPEFLPALLRGRGIRQFQLLAQTGGQRRNRCLRLGRRAWLVLAPSTIRRPLALGFVLGHEAAHLARNDTLRRRVDLILCLSLAYGAFFAATPVGWAVALGGGALLWVVPRWSAELAADAVGVRWAGAEAMRAWAGTIGPIPPLRRLAGLLTHPPLKLRLRLATRS